MDTATRATLLFFYMATQPFVYIKNTGSERIQQLLAAGHLSEVSTRRGRRLVLTEKAKSYCYGELR